MAVFFVVSLPKPLPAAAVPVARSAYGLAAARERGEREVSAAYGRAVFLSYCVLRSELGLSSPCSKQKGRRCVETRSLGSSVLGLY